MKTSKPIEKLLSLLCASSFSAGVFAGTFDTTISQTYPGGSIYSIAKTSTDVYVSSGMFSGGVYKYNLASGTWTDLLAVPMGGGHGYLAIDSGYLYLAGGVGFPDSTGSVLARYNLSTGERTKLGGAESGLSISCMVVGVDGYIYIGSNGAWPMTLPNGQASYGVARFRIDYGNSSVGWNNMGGGVDSSFPSDLRGVYSLWTSHKVSVHGNVVDYIDRVLVGGQFVKTVSSTINHNIALYETVNESINGGEPVPVSANWYSLSSGEGFYGVGGWTCIPGMSDGREDDSVVQVTKMVATPLGSQTILIGGTFESAGDPQCTYPPPTPRGWNGLASVNLDLRTISAPSQIVYDSPDCTFNGVAWVTALGAGGANNYAAGNFSLFSSGSCVQQCGGNFASLTASTFLGAFDLNQPSYLPVHDMTSDASAAAPIFIGGEFNYLGATYVPHIVRYNPYGRDPRAKAEHTKQQGMKIRSLQSLACVFRLRNAVSNVGRRLLGSGRICYS